MKGKQKRATGILLVMAFLVSMMAIGCGKTGGEASGGEGNDTVRIGLTADPGALIRR